MENGSQRSSHVFVRGSADYERYRCAYVNGNVPARYPVEIHVPGEIEGVVQAVKKAQELGVKVGVRSGGHLFPCSSLLQDGILVDMSNVNRRLVYDSDTHEITFGPAVRVREAAETLLSHKRFFPYGHAPSVALGGFCLAGGQGWFMRGWGATVSQWVTQIEIVLASGEVVVANNQQNRDIFWAARGSGQMVFGIVTKIWGRTIPARQLFHRTLVFRVEDSFKQLATFGFKRNRKTPKYGTETAMCTFYPEKYNIELKGDDVPDKGLLMAMESIAYVDTPEEAETILSAWIDIPPQMQTLLIQNEPVRPTTWAEQFAAQDALVPWGNGERWMCDSILNEPSIPLEMLLDSITPALCDLPTRTSVGCIYIGDTFPDETEHVFSLPQQYYIATFVGSHDSTRDRDLQQWLLKVYTEAAKSSCGQYIADYDDTHRKTKTLTPSTRDKFLHIRSKYDPKDMFPYSGV